MTSSDFLIPMIVDLVDQWDEEVVFVECEGGPESVTVFALVQVVGVGGGSLATKIELIPGSALTGVPASQKVRLKLIKCGGLALLGCLRASAANS